MTQKQLAGRVAIVSGAARGIGEAHVRALVAAGASVVIGDVLDDEGQALATELGAAARFVHLDVTSPTDWANAVDAAEGSQWGAVPVSILVSNAGIADHAPLDEVTLERWNRTLEVNLTGTFLGIKAVMPSMKAARSGVIVTTSSMMAHTQMVGGAHYSASKAAIGALTKTAALELGPFGIRVNSLHPGMIRTPMTEGPTEAQLTGSAPIARFGTPDEVAQTMLFIVTRATFATGAEFAVDGGILTGTAQ